MRQWGTGYLPNRREVREARYKENARQRLFKLRDRLDSVMYPGRMCKYDKKAFHKQMNEERSKMSGLQLAQRLEALKKEQSGIRFVNSKVKFWNRIVFRYVMAKEGKYWKAKYCIMHAYDALILHNDWNRRLTWIISFAISILLLATICITELMLFSTSAVISSIWPLFAIPFLTYTFIHKSMNIRVSYFRFNRLLDKADKYIDMYIKYVNRDNEHNLMIANKYKIIEPEYINFERIDRIINLLSKGVCDTIEDANRIIDEEIKKKIDAGQFVEKSSYANYYINVDIDVDEPIYDARELVNRTIFSLTGIEAPYNSRFNYY